MEHEIALRSAVDVRVRLHRRLAQVGDVALQVKHSSVKNRLFQVKLIRGEQ